MTPSPKDRRILSLASAGGTDKELVFLDKLEELTTLAEKTNELLSVPEKDIPSPLLVKIEGVEFIKGDKGDSPTNDELIALITPLIPDPIPGSPGKDAKPPTKDELIALIEPLIPDPIPGEKGDSVKGDPGKDATVDDVLEKLTPFLDELKSSMEKRIEERVLASRPIFGPGKTKIYKVDLSDQLNGVLKTFYLGTHFGVVSVDSSSAPFGAFRPDVDYQEVGKNIVFTDNVDPEISLASGQSLIIRYLR